MSEIQIKFRIEHKETAALKNTTTAVIPAVAKNLAKVFRLKISLGAQAARLQGVEGTVDSYDNFKRYRILKQAASACA
ncbi:hypothetical protein [Pelagibaculum spongiae]|uniref:Uncharacterized protein n=1 Tax=Pelagibaculum spongiae TaxID=2080658 RepID=A0A2V1GYF2_9GAMM|nr:hypothetical protein [Pelagibaculum spongiae]PVZ71806.1 hypothetical protein DC094_01905 [Pelagibaculum spongiae]